MNRRRPTPVNLGPPPLNPRWKPLYADLTVAMEFWQADLSELAAMDPGRDAAAWARKARAALGCLEGALTLLHDANRARAAALAAQKDPSKGPA